MDGPGVEGAVPPFEGFCDSLQEAWRRQPTRAVPEHKASALVVTRSVESTNTMARAAASACYRNGGCPTPSWFVAHEQTRGRGRHGRWWSSPTGLGLYSTYLWPLPEGLDRKHLMGVPLVVGVAVCRALERWPLTDCGLKWPNDVLVGGRKLGGILIEIVDGGDQQLCAIVGIGMNHGHRDDQLPLATATSLVSELPCPPSLVEFAVAVMSEVEIALGVERDMAAIIADYRQYSLHEVGDRLVWKAAEGPIEGRFEGFDENGRLLLEVNGAVCSVSAGDIESISAAVDG